MSLVQSNNSIHNMQAHQPLNAIEVTDWQQAQAAAEEAENSDVDSDFLTDWQDAAAEAQDSSNAASNTIKIRACSRRTSMKERLLMIDLYNKYSPYYSEDELAKLYLRVFNKYKKKCPESGIKPCYKTIATFKAGLRKWLKCADTGFARGENKTIIYKKEINWAKSVYQRDRTQQEMFDLYKSKAENAGFTSRTWGSFRNLMRNIIPQEDRITKAALSHFENESLIAIARKYAGDNNGTRYTVKQLTADFNSLRAQCTKQGIKPAILDKAQMKNLIKIRRRAINKGKQPQAIKSRVFNDDQRNISMSFSNKK
jgi:hypothetical protein